MKQKGLKKKILAGMAAALISCCTMPVMADSYDISGATSGSRSATLSGGTVAG